MRAFCLRSLFLATALTLAACSTNFSPAKSREITPQEFVALYRIEPADQMFYVGSHEEFHYFFHARPVGSTSLKIRRDLFRFPGEFPLAAQRDPLLLVGRFDAAAATWIQKEGFR